LALSLALVLAGGGHRSLPDATGQMRVLAIRIWGKAVVLLDDVARPLACVSSVLELPQARDALTGGQEPALCAIRGLDIACARKRGESGADFLLRRKYPRGELLARRRGIEIDRRENLEIVGPDSAFAGRHLEEIGDESLVASGQDPCARKDLLGFA